MITARRPVIVDHSVASPSLADGDYTVAALKTALGIATLSELVWLTGPGDAQANKISAEAFGALNADTGKTYQVVALTFQFAAGSGAAAWEAADSVQAVTLLSGTATTGTKTGATDGSPGPSYRFADTISLTKSGFHADLIAALGGDSAVHSPADNTVARLLIGETGLCHALAFLSEEGLLWRVSAGM